MDTSQLETFLAIYEYNNYSKAAEHLNVTQPTVTARMKNLESELSCKLFERSGKNVILTKEGKVFLKYATTILSYVRYSKEETLSSKLPSLKVGFPPGFSYSFITELIQSIISIDDLNITVIEGEDSSRLNEQIIAGELDLVLTRNDVAYNPNLISEYLFEDTLVLICGKNHRLADSDKIEMDDLHDETIIWYRRNSPLISNVDQRLIGVPNIKHIEVENNEMLKKVVASGIGVGITPLIGIDQSERDQLIVKEIKELRYIPNKIYIQYRKNLIIENYLENIISSIINHKNNKNE
ncbi:LysR family transcriptional regulator [Bacillus tuaregi]|uniref:LysR family transcriptional regulator n=1 Tax=Bacillus tuaregi TaxID=1816695 RepID=UPI0008F91856|nr:LysR family transcriptional regulator [Bacillus tuaregi]